LKRWQLAEDLFHRTTPHTSKASSAAMKKAALGRLPRIQRFATQ